MTSGKGAMAEQDLFTNAPLPVAPLGDAERLACLQLIRSENVGPVTFRRLINHFGGAQAALDALPALARRGGRCQLRILPRNSRMPTGSAPRRFSQSNPGIRIGSPISTTHPR
jgi:DNA processing protein